MPQDRPRGSQDGPGGPQYVSKRGNPDGHVEPFARKRARLGRRKSRVRGTRVGLTGPSEK
eukprot:7670709-Pyramimonas_sp.AAC.1